ncbi:MAG: hypothetical protein FVQ84_00390 [Planctomycetes bacterium]|nr:hypothetical protein [Planctomycetota bacterium]
MCLVCFWAVKSGTNDIDSIEAVVPKQLVKIESDNEAITSYKRSIDTIPDNKQEHDQIAGLRSSGYTPEAWLNEQFNEGRNNIQQKFGLAWDTINRNARYLGRDKHMAMLRQIDANARQEMLQFNQQAQQQLAQLKQIDNLATKGLITNPDEVKWRIVLGPEIESAMFQK